MRDLNWVLNSADLLQTPGVAHVSVSESDLARAHARLGSFLQEHGHRNEFRVGRYFERLVQFYLQDVRQVEMIACGLQLQQERQTIGELDFVFRDEQGRMTHWETAVKFYLYFAGTSQCGSHLIGPDPRDSFEKKVRRLFEHQLPLGARQFPEVVEQKAFVKGRIFYHPEQTTTETLPEELAPDHLRGAWIYCRELDRLDDIASRMSCVDIRAKLLNKPFWLAPEQISSEEFSESAGPTIMPIHRLKQELRQHFRDSSRPRLVSLLRRKSGTWQESERVFVVPESWPDER